MMFGKSCALIGVIHLLPLPGAAGYDGNLNRILDQAMTEASIYKETGFDALIVENTHDAPYLKGEVGPETTASMTALCQTLKHESKLPFGVQILAGANIEALAVAAACNLDFIRVEGFVFAHVGDEGMHDACAGKLIRHRFNIKADNVKVFADIKKKHSAHAITSDVSIAETANNAEYFKADGVIVTGVRTGETADLSEVRAVREAVDIPVLIGSGVTWDNLVAYAECSDALIIGSSVKVDGLWQNRLDKERCKRIVDASKSHSR
jgi:membrane complex biogenesis BtpA family protein